MDIDDCPAEQLTKELSKRHYLFMSNKCPYCRKPTTTVDNSNGTKKRICVCKWGDDLDRYYPAHTLNTLQYGRD